MRLYRGEESVPADTPLLPTVLRHPLALLAKLTIPRLASTVSPRRDLNRQVGGHCLASMATLNSENTITSTEVQSCGLSCGPMTYLALCTTRSALWHPVLVVGIARKFEFMSVSDLTSYLCHPGLASKVCQKVLSDLFSYYS